MLESRVAHRTSLVHFAAKMQRHKAGILYRQSALGSLALPTPLKRIVPHFVQIFRTVRCAELPGQSLARIVNAA